MVSNDMGKILKVPKISKNKVNPLQTKRKIKFFVTLLYIESKKLFELTFHTFCNKVIRLRTHIYMNLSYFHAKKFYISFANKKKVN